MGQEVTLIDQAGKPLGTSGNPFVTSGGGGGGGGGGTVTQGPAGAVAWPVSVAGVATAAKQPALGTAGAASADVISVQGIAGATPLFVSQGPAGASAWPVSTPTPAGIVTGQVVIATSGTAVRLGTNALVNGVLVKAKPTNAAPGFVGGSGVTRTYDGTGNGYPLEAGEAASFACSNSNAVYVNGTAGDVFSFQGN